MGTLDASIKQYKASLKESQSALAGLEDEARQLVEQVDAAHDAELLVEDCERGLENTASEKEMVREAIAEATLLDEERLPDLKRQYIELANEEKRLQGERQHLSDVIEKSRVDPTEVAHLRARLRRVSSGGSTLLDAVKSAVQDDQSAIRGRVAAVDASLPESDALELLRALGYGDKADAHEAAIERNESIRPGNGDALRGVVHRDVQRLLAKL